MSANLEPQTYGCLIGGWWLSIDYQAQAISLTRQECRKVVPGQEPWRTEQLEPGVLIDRDSEGRIVGVEVIG